jgi:hypothetical protein
MHESKSGETMKYFLRKQGPIFEEFDRLRPPFVLHVSAYGVGYGRRIIRLRLKGSNGEDKGYFWFLACKKKMMKYYS